MVNHYLRFLQSTTASLIYHYPIIGINKQRSEVKSFHDDRYVLTITMNDFTSHRINLTLALTHRGLSNFETHYGFQGLDRPRCDRYQ